MKILDTMLLFNQSGILFEELASSCTTQNHDGIDYSDKNNRYSIFNMNFTISSITNVTTVPHFCVKEKPNLKKKHSSSFREVISRLGEIAPRSTIT